MLIPHFILAWSLLAGSLAAQHPPPDAPIRIGIVGLDTSHVVEFTRRLNSPNATGDAAKVKVVAAWRGGSDIASSRKRIDKFTAQVRDMGIEIVPSIDALLERVDAVMLESLDGRSHLTQLHPILKAGKPVFIDKPLAASLTDVIAIEQLAAEHGVPWFSSSALRFCPSVQAFRRHNDKVGQITGCLTWSPCTVEASHPDLYWYGIHGVETLFTIMGPGCESVRRIHTDSVDLVTGIWKDGRVGTFRGSRDAKRGYGAVVFGKQGISTSPQFEGYDALVEAIAHFFVTGKPPIDAAETLEIYAFMSAADESKRNDGSSVVVADLLERARSAAKKQND